MEAVDYVIQFKIPIVVCFFAMSSPIFLYIYLLIFDNYLCCGYSARIPTLGRPSVTTTILLPISWADAIPRARASAGPSAVWP